MDPDELNELEELEAQSQSFDNMDTQSTNVSVSQSLKNSQSESVKKSETQSDVVENQFKDDAMTTIDEVEKETEESETQALRGN